MAKEFLLMLKKPVAIFLLFLAMCPASFGWGHEGHQILATVAEGHLGQTTLVMIQSLLDNNHLYSIASWADDVRRERPDTKGWHYVDIPLGGRYDARRDCSLPDSCVVCGFRRCRTAFRFEVERRSDFMSDAIPR
jgi:hypothetical protein